MGVRGVLLEPRFSGKLRGVDLRRPSLNATSKGEIKLEGIFI